MKGRTARVERRTGETDIVLEINLDGTGQADIETGIGFFDHMLTAFARHGLFDLTVRTRGDLHIDGHHTVEDTGICLGRAVAQALGDKTGIRRFGSAFVPMDDALVHCVVDCSGRAYFAHDFELFSPMIGAFDTQLVVEFFRSFTHAAQLNLHVRQLAGENDHHIVEAAFKALARALDEAIRVDDRIKGVLSTKGSLD